MKRKSEISITLFPFYLLKYEMRKKICMRRSEDEMTKEAKGKEENEENHLFAHHHLNTEHR